MGASLLSIFELIEFCILRIHRFRQSRKPTSQAALIKVAPSPEATNNPGNENIDYYGRNTNNINTVYGMV